MQKKTDKRNAPVTSDWDSDVKLDKQIKKIGYAGGFLVLGSCDSTNNVLKSWSQGMIAKEVEQASSGVLKSPKFKDNIEEWINRALLPTELPIVVIAEEQTAGRGRQNNTWWTGEGTLALSMLLDAKQHDLSPQTSAQLSLGIGYAAMRALRLIVEEILSQSPDKAEISAPNIEIRWPNDVYINDRKITGILIEAPNMHHIVIGIGVNTNNTAAKAPEEIRGKIATLSDILGQKIDQHRFIFLLCQEIMTVLQYFPLQLPQLIELVEQDLYQVGKIVNIFRENEMITGECLGLNKDGSLRVLTESGEKSVVSGVTV